MKRSKQRVNASQLTSGLPTGRFIRPKQRVPSTEGLRSSKPLLHFYHRMKEFSSSVERLSPTARRSKSREHQQQPQLLPKPFQLQNCKPINLDILSPKSAEPAKPRSKPKARKVKSKKKSGTPNSLAKRKTNAPSTSPSPIQLASRLGPSRSQVKHASSVLLPSQNSPLIEDPTMFSIPPDPARLHQSPKQRHNFKKPSLDRLVLEPMQKKISFDMSHQEERKSPRDVKRNSATDLPYLQIQEADEDEEGTGQESGIIKSGSTPQFKGDSAHKNRMLLDWASQPIKKRIQPRPFNSFKQPHIMDHTLPEVLAIDSNMLQLPSKEASQEIAADPDNSGSGKLEAAKKSSAMDPSAAGGVSHACNLGHSVDDFSGLDISHLSSESPRVHKQGNIINIQIVHEGNSPESPSKSNSDRSPERLKAEKRNSIMESIPKIQKDLTKSEKDLDRLQSMFPRSAQQNRKMSFQKSYQSPHIETRVTRQASTLIAAPKTSFRSRGMTIQDQEITQFNLKPKKAKLSGADEEINSNKKDMKKEQQRMAIEYLKQGNKKLKNLLHNTKTFMNMVIHDLRNPTSQIKFTLAQTVDTIHARNSNHKRLMEDSLGLAAASDKAFRMLDDVIARWKEALDQKASLEKKVRLLEQQLGDSKLTLGLCQQQLQGQEEALQQLQARQKELDSKELSPAFFETHVKAAQTVKEALPKEARVVAAADELIAALELEKLKIVNSSLIHHSTLIEEKLANFDLTKSANNDLSDCDFSIGGSSEKSGELEKLFQHPHQEMKFFPSSGPINLNLTTGAIMLKEKVEDETLEELKAAEESEGATGTQRRKSVPQALPSSLKLDLASSREEAEKNPVSQGPQTQNMKNPLVVEGPVSIQILVEDEECKDNLQLPGTPECFAEQLRTLRASVEQTLTSQNSLAAKIEEQGLESVDSVEQCKQSSMMLLNLISDLLDLAKQEKMTFQLNKEFFSLQNSVISTFKTLEFLSKKKNISCRLQISSEQDQYFDRIFGDEKRFEQILINFVSNALKFTNPDGKVEIKLECKSLSEAQGFIKERFQEMNGKVKPRRGSENIHDDSKILSDEEEDEEDKLGYIQFFVHISDNGQGISEEGLKKLFVDFSSLQEHRGMNHSGTGLGLSICKQIIQKMGGKVEVLSKVGQGTTFSIEMTCLCKIDGLESILKAKAKQEKENAMKNNAPMKGPDPDLAKEGKKESQRKRFVPRKLVKSYFHFNPKSPLDDEVGDCDSPLRHKPTALQFNDLELSSSNESVSSSSWESSSASPVKEITSEEKKKMDEAFKGFESFARRGSKLIDDPFNGSESKPSAFSFGNGSRAKLNNLRLISPVESSSSFSRDKITEGRRKKSKHKKKRDQEFSSNPVSPPSTPLPIRRLDYIVYDQIMEYQARAEEEARRQAQLEEEKNHWPKMTPPSRLEMLEKDDKHPKKRKLQKAQSSANLTLSVEEDLIQQTQEKMKKKRNPDLQLSTASFTQADLKFLVVNDDIITLVILETMLQGKILGIRPSNIEKASNGLEAYEKVIAGHFDIIIMDLNMPVMDGFQATAKIKEYFDQSNIFLVDGSDDEFNEDSPLTKQKRSKKNQFAVTRGPYIVALSASELDSDLIKRCQAARFDDQFSSPLCVNKIQKNIIDKIMFQKNFSLMSALVAESETSLESEEAEPPRGSFSLRPQGHIKEEDDEEDD